MKILVILPRFPYPLEKGDKLRAYHQIRMLAADNDIYLFALSHHKVDDASKVELQRYCRDICVARISTLAAALRTFRNLCSVRSLQIGFWKSKRALRLCLQFADSVAPDVVYAQMIRTLPYAAHLDLPKVLDYQDCLSMNAQRRMASLRGLSYFLVHYEFKMLRSAEYNATTIFDRLTIISERDRNAIPQHYDTEIEIVRNGVDFDYFAPLDIPKDYDIVFCGNMQYRPNIDAAQYLVNDIMPIVWRRRPDARVLIAGATPKPAVRALASARVSVSGSLPDIRPAYARSRLFVAPMRIGSGLQNKLLEAMAMKIPCVTTAVANNSLGASPGSEILLGNDADQFASAIVSLLDDEKLRLSMADNAYRFVTSHFSWQSATAPLEKLLHDCTNGVSKRNEV